MKPEMERQRRKAIKAVIWDVMDLMPEEPTADGLPPELESLLWDYAQGLLDPAEELRVTRILARSQQAETRLHKIRRSMTQAGMANPIEPPNWQEAAIVERARRWAGRVLAGMGRDLTSLAAIVVNAGDRLVGAVEQGGFGARILVSPLAEVLELEAETDLTAQRLEIPAQEGLSASVIRVSNERTDVLVTVANPTVQGRVQLLRLLLAGGRVRAEDTGIDGYLENGHALLEHCPEGFLRIVAPDGRSLEFCITSEPPP